MQNDINNSTQNMNQPFMQNQYANQQPMGFNQEQQQQIQQQQQQFGQPQQAQMQPQQMGGMTQPNMPIGGGGVGMGLSQFQNRQQYQQFLQQNGWQKLEQMDRVFMRLSKASGCSDQVCCAGFGVTYDLKFEKDNDDEIMEIKYEEPGCWQETIKGKVSSLNYDMQNIPSKEQMYEVEHVRKCCFAKSIITGIIPYIGWFCLFYACSACCHSTGKLKRDGNTISKYEYSCCSRKIFVTDDQKQNKFKFVRNQSQYCYIPFIKYTIQDGQTKEDLLQYKMEVEYTKVGDNAVQTWKTVRFPKNSSVDEKMTIIYGACHAR